MRTGCPPGVGEPQRHRTAAALRSRGDRIAGKRARAQRLGAPTRRNHRLRALGREHEEDIRVFGLWASVNLACQETRLYAPPNGPAWEQISEAHRGDTGRADTVSLILSLYGPGGAAHDALRDELLDPDILKPRHREAEEVLDSLGDGRYYVTICGALPLVEYVLKEASGKWEQPLKLRLEERFDKHETLPSEMETDLFLHAAAAEMLTWAIPEWWRPRKPPTGLTDELNRQWVLHGTGSGWDTRENAIRSVMLVAAAARVPKPILSMPLSSK